MEQALNSWQGATQDLIQEQQNIRSVVVDQCQKLARNHFCILQHAGIPVWETIHSIYCSNICKLLEGGVGAGGEEGRGEGEEENAQRENHLPNKILTLSRGFMSALCK